MSPLKILLADDEPEHRQLLELSIRARCPQAVLVTVENREDLLAAIRQGQFHCVVLDFNLAGTRADDLLVEMTRKGNTTPVVVISSAREQDIVVRSLRSGGADFVPKTEAFEGDVLWDRIQAAVTQHERRTRQRRLIQERVERLARLADTDPLTGIANRSGLHRVLNGRRRRLDRRGQTCCVMADIDFFKRINDSLGHPCGDRVLQSVARALTSNERFGDLTCRWGGEEFMALLPDTNLGEGMAWAERLRESVEQMRTDWAGKAVTVTLSLGVAQTPSDCDLDQQIAQADAALFLAKRLGRNRVCSWPMVALQKLAEDEEIRRTADPTEQAGKLVERADKILGPTQCEHLVKHGARVGELAERIGRRLRLEDREIAQLRLAGQYHDLGKLIVPEDILAKPAPLTERERASYRRQTQFAEEIYPRLGLEKTCVEFIQGCNGRLQDKKTPASIGAQIIAVADAYDAMTSWRPYRRTRSSTEALAELNRERGARFDPDVVDAAAAVVQQSEAAL